MPTSLAPLAPLLLGTLLLRPYVFAFLAVFAWAATRDLGALRMLGFLAWGFAVAFAAEYASTRVGRSLRPVPLHGRDAGDRALSRQCAVLRLPVVSVPRLCLLLPRAEGPRAGRSRADDLARRGRHDAARRRDRPPRGPGRSMVSRAHLLLRGGGRLLRRAPVELRGLAHRRMGDGGRIPRGDREEPIARAGRGWASASTTECCCSTWRSPGGSAKWVSWGWES